MSAKHTPGEWRVKPWASVDNIGDINCCGWQVTATNGTEEVGIFSSATEGANDREIADLALIAAAPDLLSVAEHCEDMLMRYTINRIDGEEIADAALALIRAAISKATGGQQ